MGDLTGQTLGQYTLGRLIGRGGMADVYCARQQSIGRDVAIKVMSLELRDSTEFAARFEREARVIARLQHPHIIPVIDFGRSGPYVFLVMHLIDGGELSDRLRGGMLSLQQVNRFLQQIASALDYAHQHSVIHRDLKPTNVLLDEQDNCYLTDFGIAKMLAATTSSPPLTTAGNIMGTPAYMAPEQWRSEAVDARTDTYALGVILFEMLLGALPFQSDTPYGMMYQHFDAPPPLPRALNPALAGPIEQVILRALAKTPADRYPTAGRLAADFSRALLSVPLDTLRDPLPRATPDQLVRATEVRPRLLPEMSLVLPPQPPPAAPAVIVPPQPQRAALRRSPWWWGVIAALAVVGLVTLGVLLATGGPGGDSSDDPGAVEAGSRSSRTPTRSPAIAPGRSQSGTTPTPDRVGTARALQQMHGVTGLPAASPSASGTIAAAPTEKMGEWTPSATPTATPEPTAAASLTPLPACGGLAPRMVIDGGGRTTLFPDTSTRVRAAPGTDATILRAIPPGATFGVTSGPECANSILWWEIAGYDRLGRWSGWIGEGQNGIYWIEPYRVGPLECPGAPLPRLTPGQQGRVTLDPPDPSRVRADPTVRSDVRGQLQPGDTFRVVSGPVCDSEQYWRWWQIQTDLLEGWIAEGSGGVYWIEPWL